MKEKIGIIGTGIIGSGVAKCLLHAGYMVTVYNRTRKKTNDLLTLGASIVDTPKELARAVEIVIITVWDFESLQEVTLGKNGILEGIREGQIVIDMSTQLPKTSIWEAKIYKEKGAYFLDAPVHGSKTEANSAELCSVIGGDKTIYERMLPLFRCFSKSQHYMGTNGKGNAAKLCGNLLASTIVGALCEALALTVKSEIDPLEIIQLWGESDFRSPLIESLGKSICKRDFSVSFHLRTMVKDTNLIKDFAEENSMPIFLSPIIHELYKIGMIKGFGEENASALIKVFEEMTGVVVKEI